MPWWSTGEEEIQFSSVAENSVVSTSLWIQFKKYCLSNTSCYSVRLRGSFGESAGRKPGCITRLQTQCQVFIRTNEDKRTKDTLMSYLSSCTTADSNTFITHHHHFDAVGFWYEWWGGQEKKTKKNGWEHTRHLNCCVQFWTVSRPSLRPLTPRPRVLLPQKPERIQWSLMVSTPPMISQLLVCSFVPLNNNHAMARLPRRRWKIPAEEHNLTSGRQMKWIQKWQQRRR